MKKEISFNWNGRKADIDGLTIYRMLPNRYAHAVGSFVFLDHIAPRTYGEHDKKENSTGPHPHRGIATLTYLLKGEDLHFDSRGHRNMVHSGGIQWMKAGNGIVHDEIISWDSRSGVKETHGFQFWINLPSNVKKEEPEYLAVEQDKIPRKVLENGIGALRVIAGACGQGFISAIPVYNHEFLYHLELASQKEFVMDTIVDYEYAAFLPTKGALVNGMTFEGGEFIEFDKKGGTIEIYNSGDSLVDILIFGGSRYDEPIVAEGPFVMNSKSEIAEAYKDYLEGKYGRID